MSTAIIVQARMGSTRLPGKVMMKLLGRPMLDQQIERLKRVKNVDSIIVATSTAFGDNTIEALCADLAVPCFRGSEDDVLARYYDAAKSADADTLVRVTGDCPLIDPQLIDDMIARYDSESDALDYLSNTVERTYPRGLDTEVVSMSALERAHNEATEQPQREHVTPYIWQNPDKFSVAAYTDEKDYSHHRWTVDTVQDLVLVQKMFEALYPKQPDFSWHDCLALLKQHPDWVRINADVQQKAVS